MSKKSWIIPLIVLLAAAGLLFGIAGHWTGWQANRANQKTDDAYLKADVTPLSTRIHSSGKVRSSFSQSNVATAIRLQALADSAVPLWISSQHASLKIN